MTLVNMDSQGLLILPTHRVVHGLESFSAASFREKASTYFSVEEVDVSVDAARASVILREAGRIGTALLAVAADRVFLLDRARAVPEEVFAGLSLRQQSLDVVQLHKCLLEGVLGHFGRSHPRPEKCSVHSRYWRIDGIGALWRG